MLKLTGAGMILAGCFGLGIWYRGQFLGRVKCLRMLQRILDLWESEVRYGKAALGECCLHMQTQLPEPFKSCFEKLCLKLKEEQSEPCAALFRRLLNEAMEGMPLQRADKEAFLQFIPETGYMDGRMQLLSILRSRDLLEDTIERLERENAEKCRLALGLGAMSGMLLVLILW